MSEQEVYTLTDVERQFAPTIAYEQYRRYRDYTQAANVHSVVLSWLYAHVTKVEKLLAASPQRTNQVRSLLEDAARAYCEQRKAQVLGYQVDDLYWYSAGLVDELKAMARNPNWKPNDESLPEREGKSSKPAREGGDLVAMVMDVRRAGKAVGWHTKDIVEFLGGRKPRGLE